MTIEEALKQMIIDEYGSLRAFVLQKGLTYSNVDSILRRGIKNATWTNVKKLCEALEISADALADEKIAPANKEASNIRKLEDIISTAKHDMLNADQLTLKGHTIPEARVHDLCMMLDLILDYEGMHYE